MAKPRRGLVVGGGTGGVAGATAMAQRGMQVLVVERQREFFERGVGLGQPANALLVLDALGVLTAVLDAGFLYDRMLYFTTDTELLVDHVFGVEGARRSGGVCAFPGAVARDPTGISAPSGGGGQDRHHVRGCRIRPDDGLVLDGGIRPY